MRITESERRAGAEWARRVVTGTSGTAQPANPATAQRSIDGETDAEFRARIGREFDEIIAEAEHKSERERGQRNWAANLAPKREVERRERQQAEEHQTRVHHMPMQFRGARII